MRFTHRRDQWHEPVCHVYDCNRNIREDSPVPVCHQHGMEIARAFAINLDHERLKEAEAHREAREQKQPAEMRRSGRSLVYYVRIGDHVKIGYTRHLRQRMTGLRVTTDELLAVEDGDQSLETQRHRQFAADRVGRRENFRPSDALMAHIAGLGGRDSLPAWAKLPDTPTIRFARREDVDGVA